MPACLVGAGRGGASSRRAAVDKTFKHAIVHGTMTKVKAIFAWCVDQVDGHPRIAFVLAFIAGALVL